jgi:hypothetical protein
VISRVEGERDAEAASIFLAEGRLVVGARIACCVEPARVDAGVRRQDPQQEDPGSREERQVTGADMALDDTDRRILQELLKDGRASHRELAERTGP